MNYIQHNVFILISSLFLTKNIAANKTYSMITKWHTGTDMINTQNCFALNFGYNGEIPFPTLNLKVTNNGNLGQYDFEQHYKCFYVFVARQYIDDLENVMEIVENVVDKFYGFRPIAMFMMGKYTTTEINKFSEQTKQLTLVYIKVVKYP